MTLYSRRGLAFFENGEGGTFTNWATQDSIKGKGIFQWRGLFVPGQWVKVAISKQYLHQGTLWDGFLFWQESFTFTGPKPPPTYVREVEDAQRWIDRGVQYMMLSTDAGLLLRVSRERLEALRKMIS